MDALGGAYEQVSITELGSARASLHRLRGTSPGLPYEVLRVWLGHYETAFMANGLRAYMRFHRAFVHNRLEGVCKGTWPHRFALLYDLTNITATQLAFELAHAADFATMHSSLGSAYDATLHGTGIVLREGECQTVMRSGLAFVQASFRVLGEGDDVLQGLRAM